VNVVATIAGLVAAFCITLQNSSSPEKTDPNCGPVCVGIAFAALTDTAPPELYSLVKSARVQENGCANAASTSDLLLRASILRASRNSISIPDRLRFGIRGQFAIVNSL
jgi:hypothetical protein